MIAYIKGKVLSAHGLRIELLAGPIGYEITVPLRVLPALEKNPAEVELFVHHHIGAESQRLYGFLDRQERDFFRDLIAIKGVGPGLVLSILSHVDRLQFMGFCQSGDAGALSRIPRIGKKTAERLLFEINSRNPEGFSQPSTSAQGADNLPLQALLQLGYKEADIRKVLGRIEQGPTLSDTILRALKEL